MRRIGLMAWLLLLHFGVIACLLYPQWWIYEAWAAGVIAFVGIAFVGTTVFVLIS